jgi:hypothetical protein
VSSTGSSLISRFRPSPCPNHYDGRLATMPSADFCLITARVTPVGAIGLYLVRSPAAIHSLEPRHFYTRALLVIYRSLVKQISPDRSMNFPCATASFTVAVRSHGFVVLDPKRFAGPTLPTRLQPTPHMMFLFISSQFALKALLLVRPASSRPALTG